MPQIMHMRQIKDSLRQQYKSMRSAFSGNGRLIADGRILQNFLCGFGGYQSYFVYHSCRGEADTLALVSLLLRLGKTVCLPRVEGKDMVAVPYGALKKGRFGTMEPCGAAFGGDIDVTVTPLLAVGKNGERLGYGGGYYDRYFAYARTLRVGLGYSFQLTEKAFSDDGDVPLDAFVSENGVLRFGR